MAEAEDVLVDAARHVTARALALWRRRRGDTPPPGGVDLAMLKPRLALLVAAWLDRPLPLRAAAAPPPATLLARLFRRGARPRAGRPLPATDGVAIYLPPAFDAGSRAATLDFYRVSALHQALRCRRGSAAVWRTAGSALVADLMLISELVAVDAGMARDMPGLRAALRAVRARSLAARPPVASLHGVAMEMEALYQAALRDGAGAVPCAASASDSLAWARRTAARFADVAFRGLLPDESLGEVLPLDAAAGVMPGAAAPADERAGAPRTASLARRPRVRAARPDEDDAGAGPVMVQSSPPSEHVEDPHGLQRPIDRDAGADLDGAAESLADLEEARLVSTPGTPREVLVSEAPPEARAAAPARAGTPDAAAIAYPEWDWRREGYVPAAVLVRETTAPDGPAEWVEHTLARHRLTLQRVRRRFEALRARRAILHRQRDGADIDLEAFVATLGDRRARLPRDDRVYLATPPARRDLALLILIDVSGSTDAWVSAGRRIIDVEKEALLVVAAALEALGLDSAMFAFSGYGPADVRLFALERFAEHASPAALGRRIAGLEPEQFTRLGAAVRHATALLARQPHRHRLLLLLSDGKPNDCDRYEGRYGLEDTRQALAEARLQGIAPYCVTVDRHASALLPRLFGPYHFTVVHEPAQLAGALVDWLRAAALAAR